MTVHKYYIGGMGPYLYDDTELINDADGDFAGEYQSGLITSGEVKTTKIPTAGDEVLRLDDLGSIILSAEKIVEEFIESGTITYTSNVILVSGTFDLFLPTVANGEKRVYDIKNIGTGIITLKPNSAESSVEIEGETEQLLYEGDCATVTSDATEWWVI